MPKQRISRCDRRGRFVFIALVVLVSACHGSISGASSAPESNDPGDPPSSAPRGSSSPGQGSVGMTPTAQGEASEGTSLIGTQTPGGSSNPSASNGDNSGDNSNGNNPEGVGEGETGTEPETGVEAQEEPDFQQAGGTTCDCGATSSASPCTGTSVREVRGGTTFEWTFNCNGGPCVCGQFATGDHWVATMTETGDPVEAVTLTASTPDGVANGVEANPASAEHQGVLDCTGSYEASRNLMTQLPAQLRGNTSLIKADRREGECGTASILGCCIDSYSALTVLGQTPPRAGSTIFRPGFAGDVKTLYSTDDIDLARLPRIPQVSASSNQSSFSSIVSHWTVPFYDHFMDFGDRGRAYTPAAVLPDYGAAHAATYLSDMLSVMGTEANSAKAPAVYALVQRGIDLYTSWKVGIRWHSGAGQSMGRKPPVAFFSALHTSDAVRRDVAGMAAGTSGGSQDDFQEDGQIKVIQDGGNVPVWGDASSDCSERWYWTQIVSQQAFRGGSGREWGSGDNKRTCGDPYGYIDGPAGQPGNAYQVCCSTGGFKAYALGQWLMPELRAAANDPQLLGYVDRFMGHAQGGGFQGGIWTVPDRCAPPDPRESEGCAPYRDGAPGCQYYGQTWGPDPARPGHCIEHGGDPYTDGRFPALHGHTFDPGHTSALSRELWPSLRSCAANCSCSGQNGLCDTTQSPLPQALSVGQ